MPRRRQTVDDWPGDEAWQLAARVLLEAAGATRDPADAAKLRMIGHYLCLGGKRDGP